MGSSAVPHRGRYLVLIATCILIIVATIAFNVLSTGVGQYMQIQAWLPALLALGGVFYGFVHLASSDVSREYEKK